jgi:hypothetical protein
MKRCSQCDELKPESEYGRDSTVKGGLRAACKRCRNAANKLYRDQTYDPIRKAEEQRRYRERHPESLATQRKSYRAKYPDRKRANDHVDKAVRRGDLVRPGSCSWCEVDGRVEGAHVDYDRPLDVVWLCVRCHRKLDAALSPLRDLVERLKCCGNCVWRSRNEYCVHPGRHSFVTAPGHVPCHFTPSRWEARG